MTEERRKSLNNAKGEFHENFSRYQQGLREIAELMAYNPVEARYQLETTIQAFEVYYFKFFAEMDQLINGEE
jgi:hypothetical protein